MIARMGPADLLEESTHLFGLHAVAYHPVQGALLWSDGSVEVAELSDQGQLDHRPYRVRCPTARGITHAPEAGFVLKQHQDRQVANASLVLYRFSNGLREVFLKSPWASTSTFGWRVSGAILRQPWRASIRYTVDLGTLWPTVCSSAAWIGGTTNTPPLSAFSSQGARKLASSSIDINSRRLPPRFS